MTDQSHSDETWDRYSNQIIAGLALLVLLVGRSAIACWKTGAGWVAPDGPPTWHFGFEWPV
jgi:hypothetical protein